MADGQENLVAAIHALAVRPSREMETIEAETRSRLRSIDVQLLRILEEMTAGRQESVTDLRRDLARLTRVIEVAAEIDPGAPDGQGH